MGVEKRGNLGLAVLATAQGWVALVASERGIVAATLPQPTPEEAMALVRAGHPEARPWPEDAVADAARQIRQYLDGERKSFQIPLDLSGHTPFRRQVWEVTQRIPYGETRSYAWVARQLGKPRAARAVGQALGANPVPMLVPCHRVVGSDGSLGGYTGGPGWKERLLRLEGTRGWAP